MKLKSLKAVFASIFARPPRPAEPCPAEPCPADGHEFEVDGIRYIITSSEKLTVELNRGSFYTGGISIPASVTYKGRTYAVTSIGYQAFSGFSGLTSVTIPNSVTSIGNGAFEHCTGLTSVEIPNSVTSIGNGVFGGCSALTSVTIPDSVMNIGGGLCERSTKLCLSKKNSHFVLIDDILYTADRDTLIHCNSQSSHIVVNKDTKAIAAHAFDSSSLTSVTLPDGLRSIGERAFYMCKGLTSVEIPNSVTSIGDVAFEHCTGLTSVEIPNSVTSIGNGAFFYCESLTSMEIPNSVTSIGYGAFGCCSALTSVTIPNSVTSIGDGAFSCCTALTSIEIPNSVTSIGSRAFIHCSSLSSLTSFATMPPTCDSDFDEIVKAACTLHVPAGTKSRYQAAPQWKDFDNIVEDAEMA